MTRNENSTKMLRDLILEKDLQVNIANKYGYSESYVSQIAKQIRELKYKPLIENNLLLCFKCGKESEQLDIHHINFQPIAIVCHGCNIKLKQNELTYETEQRKNIILEYIRNNKNIEITSTSLFNMFKDEFKIYSESGIKLYLQELQKEQLIKKLRGSNGTCYIPFEDRGKERAKNSELMDRLVLLMIKSGINSDDYGISITEKEIEPIINRLQESDQIG